MTLTDIGLLEYPLSRTTSIANATCDATDEGYAQIFQIPKTGTLKKICFLTGTVTTADDVIVRLETVDDTTGLPTGTLYAANANGTQALSDTDDSALFWVALNGSTGISVTAGAIVALVIKIDYVNGNLALSYSGGIRSARTFPYSCYYAAAAWTKVSGTPLVSLEYSDSIVCPIGCIPVAKHSNTTMTTSSTPNVRGNRIRFPMQARTVGAWFHGDIDNAADVVLYGSDGVTALSTVSLDPDIRSGTSAALQYVMFSTPITLAANTYYRICLKPTTTSAIGYSIVTVLDDGSLYGLDASEVSYANCHESYAKDPANEASWTQTTNRINIGLLVDQIDIAGLGSFLNPTRKKRFNSLIVR